MNSKITTSEAKKISAGELLRRLSADENGLSSSEAGERLKQCGPNEIAEKKTNPALKFLSYFWGPIAWMIEAAVILSAIVRHWEDFAVIFALLLINALVGFWQENKAQNAIELLKSRLAPTARVRRDGKWLEIAAQEVVPGDIVRVRLGDIVPADVKFLKGEYVLIDESALTGESLPVEKHEGGVGYSGSVIRRDEMDTLVISTGMNTYFGKTAKLVEDAQTRSHFQKAVIKIGDYLIAISVSLVLIVVVASLLRGQSSLQTLLFALILIVASIPVALPAVLTVTMAVGAVALAKKEAIVSRLAAIEEMAGEDVLCADKTGTITKNELAIREVYPVDGFSDEDVLLDGALASREDDHDPIDDAVIAKARSAPSVTDKLKRYHVVSFKPFDPVVKRTEATVEFDHKSFNVAKGAPQVILSLVHNKETVADDVNERVDTFAARGFRSLGVARSDDQGNWRLAGILAIYDPPRRDSAETIRIAQSMGVEVKMITGDHSAIAKEIAPTVNLGAHIVTSEDFIDKEESEAIKVIESADGFAEVFPEHKYRIVKALQENNHIVGMTGDGVNDAPALKRANAGIAVAGASDAAKSAADIVLTQPGLSVIIDTIKQSRMIFERMTTYATYRIAETIRILIFITLTILVFNFKPVTAVMIVILSLLNDIPIMTIAYDNTKLQMSPVAWEMPKVITIALVLGVVGVFSTFGLLVIAKEFLHLSDALLRTLIFLKLAVAGHLTIYLVRSGERQFWNRPLPAGILFGTTEVTQILGTLVAVYGVFMSPIGWALAGLVWAYALVTFVITGFIKTYTYRLVDRKYGVKE